MSWFFNFLDWFVPQTYKRDRSDLGLARIFVFTHIFGPALGQSISVFLYRADPDPGLVCWIIIAAVCSFWLLPFLLKLTKSLQLVALLSLEILSFASLFGAYFYGGVSSPFLPWLIVALFIGFFYLSNRPKTLATIFAVNLTIFTGAYLLFDFPQRLPLEAMSGLGWASIASATIYMAWMAVYYNIMISTRSELEQEAVRHRETALRLRAAKEAADKANRDRSIFLAKMSHELRTPLNAVIGYSELLLEDELERTDQANVADLRRINEGGKHLLSLVADVLDVSKIEENILELNISSFDVASLIESAAETVRPMAEQRSNRLSVEVRGQLGVVKTDSTKLRQILLNLLGNAAKFTERGSILITAIRSHGELADWVEIRVQDTGIGIAESQIADLFVEFSQTDSGKRSKCEGTGLGLAVSQRLCWLLGGEISCQSVLGRGSCFTVRIPAVLDPSADSRENESDPLADESVLAA